MSKSSIYVLSVCFGATAGSLAANGVIFGTIAMVVAAVVCFMEAV